MAQTKTAKEETNITIETGTTKMPILVQLWIIQTQMEVKKTASNDNRYQCFSTDEIMTQFHAIQKSLRCVLLVNCEEYMQANGEMFVKATARLVNIDDPNDFVEVIGETKHDGKNSKLGTAEQQFGASGTYAKRAALCNLFGIVAEQRDIDLDVNALPQNLKPDPVTSKTVKANVVAPPPKAPAKVAAPAPAAQVVSQQAPVATAAKVVYEMVGDGQTLKLSDLETPLVFKAPANYTKAQLEAAGKVIFQFADLAFDQARILNLSCRDAMNTLFMNHKTEALVRLQKAIEIYDPKVDLEAPVKKTIEACQIILNNVLKKETII